MSSSKKYKGKTCAYCAVEGASATGDHVFAREFFEVSARANLPKVPACEACNRQKSELEHYLTAVLPFGGMHTDAAVMLNEYVPPRLAANAKLHGVLATSMRYEPAGMGDLLRQQLVIDFDSEKLAELFVYITRGLAMHHWQAALPADCNVRAGMVSSFGELAFRHLLSLNGRRVEASLGNGTFAYEGLQSVSDARITVWRFTVFGGVRLAGDPDLPNEMPDQVWATSSGTLTLFDLDDNEVAVRR